MIHKVKSSDDDTTLVRSQRNCKASNTNRGLEMISKPRFVIAKPSLFILLNNSKKCLLCIKIREEIIDLGVGIIVENQACFEVFVSFVVASIKNQISCCTIE